eukprot:532551_1
MGNDCCSCSKTQMNQHAILTMEAKRNQIERNNSIYKNPKNINESKESVIDYDTDINRSRSITLSAPSKQAPPKTRSSSVQIHHSNISIKSKTETIEPTTNEPTLNEPVTQIRRKSETCYAPTLVSKAQDILVVRAVCEYKIRTVSEYSPSQTLETSTLLRTDLVGSDFKSRFIVMDLRYQFINIYKNEQEPVECKIPLKNVELSLRNVQNRQKCIVLTIKKQEHTFYFNSDELREKILQRIEIWNKNQCSVTDTTHAEIISKCTHLMRLCIALKYYHVLLSQMPKNSKEKFTAFCMESYKQCLNDYIHAISIHSNILNNKIRSELATTYGLERCELNNCKCTQRHFRNRGRNNYQNGNDNEDHFYIELFDTLHFYINHVDIMGFRFYAPIEKHDYENNVDNDANCFDSKLVAIQKDIQLKTKQNSSNAARNVSKFNISVEQKTDNTFVDYMFIWIQNNNWDKIASQQLDKFIRNEEFDTETIIEDIKFPESNLSHGITNVNDIKLFTKEYTIKTASFSTGLVFWYWSWYLQETNQKIFEDQQAYWNKNDFGGYKLRQLFISKRYDSIKSEVLQCGVIEINNFNELVVKKSKHYIDA